MDREAFEQLVSEWLDRPHDAELRARVRVAVERSPDLARLLDEWTRLDRLVRDSSAAPLNVDWKRFTSRVAAAIDVGDQDAALSAALRAAGAVDERVDWERFRQRVSQAVARDQRPTRPRILRKRAPLVGALALAAAIALMFWLREGSPAPPVSSVYVTVSSGNAPVAEASDGVAFARVSPPLDEPRSVDDGEPQLVEVFLIIDPPAELNPVPAQLSGFGFH